MPYSIDPLSNLLEEAGVHKDSIIRVTGPHGLAALLWLCRHGYQQAGYLRADGFATMAEAQVLIVSGPLDPPALEALLDHGPRLCDGGLLIVQTPDAPLGDPEAPHRIFRRHDMVMVRRVHRHGRQLCLARRVAGAQACAA
jgi:hypothetical protein